ncbi:MAG: glycine cleavage system aminomethyltransferase GcvT [Deltaproteobacteria bacterium]|nr:glycine cleavage system aminomethyltransferase GcvT [Deltaproteobacteria bacterium]
MADRILGLGLEEMDPFMSRLEGIEKQRQARKIILIASESISPKAVKDALAGSFSHIYAEGYPSRLLSSSTEEEIQDLAEQLSYVRRYGDPRYYKGCEYADILEALAKRRVAEVFANDDIPPERIFANVQPMSGAAANNAVYEAFLDPGDRVLGLTLAHGGHLTHGSPVNRSGKRYDVFSYEVSAKGSLDYDAIEKTALATRPKLIIAGFSAYPWDIDWQRFREIADKVPGKPILLADIAHTAGLVAAGHVNSPIGHADVVSFTTHKTMCGPRGAVILCTDPEKAKRINMAVFPGEQGGPHLHTMAAKAVAFKIAASREFKTMMKQVQENAAALAGSLEDQGLKLAYGGTNTHMLLLDLTPLKGSEGISLTGETASRILDLAQITCNKNTIRGDTNAAHPSAIRLGTTWVSQRGMTEKHMIELAKLIARVLKAIEPFEYLGGAAPQGRGKIDPAVLADVRADVEKLLFSVDPHEGELASYPYFLHNSGQEWSNNHPLVIEVRGRRSAHLLNDACTADVFSLGPGNEIDTLVLSASGKCIAEGRIKRLKDRAGCRTDFILTLEAGDPGFVLAWLRELSDGYVKIAGDLYAKAAGPAVIHDLTMEFPDRLDELKKRGDLPKAPGGSTLSGASAQIVAEKADLAEKTFFIGQQAVFQNKPAPKTSKTFTFEPAKEEARMTCLYDEHVKLTTKHAMAPFAGWLMPMRYKGLAEEHQAVRMTAGLFDVSHMGVLEVTGPRAERFLNLATTNYVPALFDNKAHYSYLLAPDGRVIDDILVYRRSRDRFMVVVNAANAEEDEAWLRAVNQGDVDVDFNNTWRRMEGGATIRNLKDPSSGDDQRIDMALQGPASFQTLARLVKDPDAVRRLGELRPFWFMETEIKGAHAIISRTGYTGERIGFELYVHPDAGPVVWRSILEAGNDLGVIPAGLAARDSTRTEAGLPLHGHELAGPNNVSPVEAGYGGFVKLHKPFFIGRSKCLEWVRHQDRKIVCFELEDDRGRVPRPGSPVADAGTGKCIGTVTSIAGVAHKQFGMALIQSRYAVPENRLALFPLAGRPKSPAKWPAELEPGDMASVSRFAVVLPRFPLAKTAPVPREIGEERE